MNKRNLILNIIITVLMLVSVLTVFMPYVKITQDEVTDAAEKNIFTDSLGNNLIGDFGEIVSDAISSLIGESNSGIRAFKKISDMELDKEKKLYKVRNYTEVVLVFAWVMPAVTVILVWVLKGKLKYILAGVTSLLSGLAMASIALLVPRMTKNAMVAGVQNLSSEKIYDKYVNSVMKYFGTFTKDLMIEMLAVGYWLFICLMVAAIAAEVVGLVLECKQVKGSAAVNKAFLMGLSGMYDGASVEIGDGILIGRDPNKCQLIVEGTDVSRRHCLVKYNGETDKYIITDYSSNGTYIVGGKRLEENVPTSCEKGTIIRIGKKGDTFRLS